MHGSTLHGNLWWWILKQFLLDLGVGSMSGDSVHLPWRRGRCKTSASWVTGSFEAGVIIPFSCTQRLRKSKSRIDSQQAPALCYLWEVEILSIVSLSNNKELIMKINRCDSPLHESLPPIAIILSLWRRHREPFSGTRSGGWQDLGPQGTGHLALSGLRNPLPFILYKQFFPLIFSGYEINMQ